MTLNTTIFPAFAHPAIAGEFTRMVVGTDGTNPELNTKRMQFYAERLDDIVRASPDWNAAKRIIVAHSFGGMLALHWLANANNNPLRRVDGVVLMGTTAGPMFDAVRPRIGPVRVSVGPLRWLWFNKTVTQVGDMLLGHGSRRRVDFQRLTIKSDLWVGLHGWQNTDWRARRSYRVAMDGFDVRDKLKQINVRTIVLHGTKDVYFPVSGAEALGRGLPRGELRVVQGAAHNLPLTHGAEVSRAVEDLLG